MAYKVNLSDECEAWLDGLERDVQKAVAAHIGLLAEYGPQLARPYADTVNSPVKKSQRIACAVPRRTLPHSLRFRPQA